VLSGRNGRLGLGNKIIEVKILRWIQMKSTARKHHYLPQAYLAAFTDTGLKNGQFWVIDTSSGARFCTSPKNVASERDFNRVDVIGKAPDIFENALSKFENHAVQACRNVDKTHTFPSDEDYNYILNMLCLFAVRNPQLRRSFNRSREQMAHIYAELLVSDPKIFSHHLKKAQEAGDIPEPDVSFEEMKQFIDERRYKIEFAPGGNLRMELDNIDKLLPILGQRTWSLLLSPSIGPSFICSDHPIALTWKNSQNRGPFGYGTKNTELFFPLGPRTGFYGVYEEPLHAVIKMKPAHVAVMNSRIAVSAERHIMSPTETFFIWYDGKIREIECRSNK
jgi:hypothetical protein